MSRHTDNGQVVGADPIELHIRQIELRDLSPWLDREHWLACERISRYGLSTGPGEREGCSALATLDNSPRLILSDGGAELEALKYAVDGPALRDFAPYPKKPRKPRAKSQKA